MNGQRRALLMAAGLTAWTVPARGAGEAAAAARMASRHLGADRGFRVQVPDSHGRGAQTYPLLLVLDAQQHFTTVAATARFLAEQEEIPELIVVGVDSGKRVHDYTQTDWPQGWIGGGGAAKFRRFLADELLPTLERSYRTSGERLLLGHSAAGQFALHVLATEPAMFQSYFVLSPSLDWDQRLPARELAAGFQSRDRLAAFVYVAEDQALGGALTDQLQLRQVLAEHGPRGVDWRVVNYPREGHGSVLLQGTIDALRARWHGWRVHPDEAGFLAEISQARGIDALSERYAALARGGRAVAIPEAAFVAVAEAHLRRHEREPALALLRRGLAAHPASTELRALQDRAEKAPAQAPASR